MDATRRQRVLRRVAVPAGQQVIMAVLAGQSNIVGRNIDDGLDVDSANVYQFVGDPAQGDYRTLATDITLLDHPDGLARVGPGINLLGKLKAQYPSAKVVAVPCGVGSSAMASGPTPPWASDGTGTYYETMVDQANRARTAILAQWPGASITPIVFLVQGEQDGANGCAGATYYAALSSWVTNTRTRITGAGGCRIVIGSMVPEKFDPAYSGSYVAGYGVINQQHVAASVNLSNVFYARGPVSTGTPDYLHYQPQAVARAQGDRLGDILVDGTGPTMTSASTGTGTAGITYSLSLTSNDPYSHATFHINGGADAAQFEISDMYLSPVLRWVGNSTGPVAGTYVVGVRARDGAGNYGATQTITITQNAAASGTWSNWAEPVTTTSESGWANYTIRMVIPAAKLPKTGSKIRWTLKAGPGGFILNDAFVGPKGASAPDFSATPTRCTFGGANGVTVAGAASITCDDTSFTVSNVDHVISLNVSASGGGDFRWVGNAALALWYKAITGDAATVTTSGYANYGARNWLDGLEVYG